MKMEAKAMDGELAEAVWQILDDFGRDGLSVCGAAKARLRIAYEPFREDDDALEFTLEEAVAIESSL